MSIDQPDGPVTDREGAILTVSNLVAGYGGAAILRGITLTVGSGEVVSVVGPNGCGKSTLLKALLGLVQVTSGEVQIAGENVTRMHTDLRVRQVGYVAQNREVFDALTAFENLQVAGHRMEKTAFRRRCEDMYELFPQLGPLRNRRAGVLSGGERKMLAIAMALVVSRKLLILDEPTAALAPSIADDFLENHLRAVASAGTSVLIVEQRVHAALAVSDRAYAMVDGTISMSGAPQELIENDDFARSLVG
jgi:branched-chain amino acid transport system ATP-binding protein